MIAEVGTSVTSLPASTAKGAAVPRFTVVAAEAAGARTIPTRTMAAAAMPTTAATPDRPSLGLWRSAGRTGRW